MSRKLRESLAHWYELNQRSMPWRETKDPYKIWLSEIIMQQTRVAQGTPYYLRFIESFPDVHALAGAAQDDVLKLWEGLGYYSRARNMHKAAKYISETLSGTFPTDYITLLKLPGVGPYTASAISSICYNEPRAVVDGNVVRVLSRLKMIPFRYDKPVQRKEYDKLAQHLISIENPGDHNQAMMELGAIVCTPKTPSCELCPFQQNCSAFKNGIIAEYPPAKKRSKKKTRYFHYLMLNISDDILIRQRSDSDIWQGLYELPYIEQEEPPSDVQWLEFINQLCSLKPAHKPVMIDYHTKHVLSHQNIMGKFYELRLERSLADGQRKSIKDVLLIKKSQLRKYAYPRILNRFFEEHL